MQTGWAGGHMGHIEGHYHDIPQHTHYYRMIPWTPMESAKTKGGLPSATAVRDYMRSVGKINKTIGVLAGAAETLNPEGVIPDPIKLWENAAQWYEINKFVEADSTFTSSKDRKSVV